jgi:4-amino-4-deoxy-L-arabinose transferase-like glycosyltransferase
LTRAWSPRAVWLLVGAITAVGLLLCLPSYNDSLFGDELSTYFIVSGHSLGHALYLLRDHSIDLNPPLLFALAWTAAKLGDHAQLIALPSLLAGTAMIPFTYLLGLRTIGRPAALVGAALTALSPFLIFYSTEAHAYAMMALLTVLAAPALWQALDGGGIRWWAAYAACSCVGLYTSYLSVFPLAALFIWALWDGDGRRRALLMANIAAAIGFLPWLPTFIKETHSPGASVPDFLTRHAAQHQSQRRAGVDRTPVHAAVGDARQARCGAGRSRNRGGAAVCSGADAARASLPHFRDRARVRSRPGFTSSTFARIRAHPVTVYTFAG